MPPSSRHSSPSPQSALRRSGRILLHAPLARTPVAAARLRWFLERTLERVAREAPDAVAVDLIGSLARGEGTVLELGERPLVLSDLDLAVVLPDGRSRERAAPRLARASLALASDFATWDFLGAVDLGAYAVADLPRQAARPGTLEWARSGVTLAGDAELRARVPVHLPAAIPFEEILRLLENRLLELLAAHAGATSDRRRLWAAVYAGGKGVLDAALARLLMAGECPVGVEERSRVYAQGPRGDAAPSAESVGFWTTFKLTPTAASVAGRYGAHLGLGEWAEGAWCEGGRALLAAYHDIVVTHWPAADGAWLARAAGRARHRRRIRRALDAWRENRRRGLAWGRLGNVGRFAQMGAPEHVLGAAAAQLVAEAVGESAGTGGLPGLSKIGGFVAQAAAAPWEERRRQAVLAWDRWVLRGTRTGGGVS